MKYACVLLFVCAAIAAPTVDEENVQAAQFMHGMGGMNPMMDPMYGMMNMGMNPMMNMGYPGMNNMGMNMGMNMGYPGMGGMSPMYYNSKREDYPIDYNQGCSSSCSCASQCQVNWWMPCNCRCPPLCPPPPPPPCSCSPCMNWSCPPRCCSCGGCENNNPPQDPEIPEWPLTKPDDDEAIEDPLKFPILNDLRNRLENMGVLPERKPGYPADIIIRWRDN